MGGRGAVSIAMVCMGEGRSEKMKRYEIRVHDIEKCEFVFHTHSPGSLGGNACALLCLLVGDCVDVR